MSRTLQQKIDTIIDGYDGSQYSTKLSDIDKAIQELREEILSFKISHARYPIEASIRNGTINNILALIGEKK